MTLHLLSILDQVLRTFMEFSSVFLIIFPHHSSKNWCRIFPQVVLARSSRILTDADIDPITLLACLQV